MFLSNTAVKEENIHLKSRSGKAYMFIYMHYTLENASARNETQ